LVSASVAVCWYQDIREAQCVCNILSFFKKSWYEDELKFYSLPFHFWISSDTMKLFAQYSWLLKKQKVNQLHWKQSRIEFFRDKKNGFECIDTCNQTIMQS
jgi:hypothetical protein